MVRVTFFLDRVFGVEPSETLNLGVRCPNNPEMQLSKDKTDCDAQTDGQTDRQTDEQRI